MADVPAIALNNGTHIPQLGFGVFQIGDAVVADAVGEALRAGYRSVDTAAGYFNERGVGHALAESGLARDDVYVTTKLANDHHGYDRAMRAFDASLTQLGLEYVDLYLIHWPRPRHDQYLETWRAFEKIYADGRAKAIGVSNFQIPHLLRVLGESDVVPALNQIELHPYLVQAELRAFHSEHGIATEAWSPLAKGGALLTDPVISTLGEKYARTPAQIVLRWHVELGNVVIPKSVTPARITQNIDVFDFELDPDDIEAITDLDAGHRTGPDPDTFG
jgi:diketogulonate reductase-like aldo/keto reductase